MPSVKARFHFDIRVKFSLFFTHIFSGVFCLEKGAQSLWVKERKIITMSNFVLRKTFAPDFLLFSCRLKIHSRRREENLRRQKGKKRETERPSEEKKRKTLLNIIEKTCCINDFVLRFHIAAVL